MFDVTLEFMLFRIIYIVREAQQTKLEALFGVLKTNWRPKIKNKNNHQFRTDDVE